MLAVVAGYIISFLPSRFLQVTLCIAAATALSWCWYAIPHWNSVRDTLHGPGAGFIIAAIVLWSILAFGVSLFVAIICQSRRQRHTQHDG
jgi:hypothetical protein